MEQAAPTPGTNSSSRGGAAPEDVRVRPTQQGTVYLWTLGVFSMFLLGFKANLAFLLGAFALGCAGVAWALTRRGLAQVRVDREAPRRTRVGVPTPMAWVVHNEGARTRIGIELEDRPARGAKPVRIFADVPVVAGGRSERCEGEVVFARRGEVDLGRQPLLIGTRYPLGLFRVSGRVRAPGRILVRPVEGRVTPRLRSHVRGRRPIEARQRLAQGDDVIYGVREYREGDDPRRIHWRTTARRGTLAVSEWRTEEGREAVLILGRGSGAGATSSAHFERAVAAAATIWRACIRERLHVTLEFGDGSPLRSAGDGRGLDAGLDALARLGAQGSRKPRGALRRLAATPSRRAVLYVTAARETGLEADLTAAAGPGGSGAVVPGWSRALERWVVGLPS